MPDGGAVRFHRFDAIQIPRMTPAAFSRAFHSRLYLRAQCAPYYGALPKRAPLDLAHADDDCEEIIARKEQRA